MHFFGNNSLTKRNITDQLYISMGWNHIWGSILDYVHLCFHKIFLQCMNDWWRLQFFKNSDCKNQMISEEKLKNTKRNIYFNFSIQNFSEKQNTFELFKNSDLNSVQKSSWLNIGEKVGSYLKTTMFLQKQFHFNIHYELQLHNMGVGVICFVAYK